MVSEISAMALVSEGGVYVTGTNALAEYNALIVKCLTMKTTIDDLQRRQKAQQVEFDTLMQQVRESLEMMKQEGDPVVAQEIHTGVKELLERTNEIIQEQDPLTNQIFRAQMEANREVLICISDLAPLTESVIFQIRRELGMPEMDTKVCGVSAAEAAKKISQDTSALFDHFERRVSETEGAKVNSSLPTEGSKQ